MPGLPQLWLVLRGSSGIGFLPGPGAVTRSPPNEVRRNIAACWAVGVVCVGGGAGASRR